MLNPLLNYSIFVFLWILSLKAISHPLSTDNCEYEAGECGWHFASPQPLYSQKPLDNFQVIQPTDSSSTRYAYAKMAPSRRQPAMLISPYYQYLSDQCEVRFSYRGQGAEIYVSTESLAATRKNLAAVTDTADAIFQKKVEITGNQTGSWDSSGTIKLQNLQFPTRIRFECHANPRDSRLTKVKCHIDNIKLLNCEEELFSANNCDSNNYGQKYLCSRDDAVEQKCIEQDMICDLQIDCYNGEDEDQLLHNCSKLPLGAYCKFENRFLDSGCTGWNLTTFFEDSDGKHYSKQHSLKVLNIEQLPESQPSLRLPPNDHTYSPSTFGYFLYLDAEPPDNNYNTGTVTVFESPFFNGFATDEYNANEEPCTVRFFYCYVSSGSSTSFDLMIYPKNEWKLYRIWSAPTDFPPSSNKSNCQWTKASVEIPPQNEPYKVQFIADSSYHKTVKIAIDDISMSPNCFKYALNEAKTTTSTTLETWNQTESAKDFVAQDMVPNASQTYVSTEMNIQRQNQITSIVVINRDNLLLMATVISFCSAVIFLLLCGCCCSYLYSYLKKNGKQCDLLSSQINLHAIKTAQPVNVSKNLIYESLGLTTELRTIPRENIILKNALGQGAFGEVFEGTLITDGRKVPVAVKSLPTTTSKDAIDDFEMEALIMSKFQHENICSLKGVCFERSPRLIVLELLAGGDLKSFLRDFRLNKKCTEDLKISDLLKMAIDIAKGCKYLSDNRFIHRDIAARNCLLTKKGKGRVVKIADFGMARDIYRQEYYRKGGKSMLPIKWMPPEAFLEGIFTSKTDVWSYGVLLWELFSLGYVPYPGRNNHEVMTLVVEGSRLGPPSGVPVAIYALMMECWKTVDTQRPDFAYILNRLESMMKDSTVTSASVFNCLCINNKSKLMLLNNADETVETRQLITSSNTKDDALSTDLCSEGTTAIISDYSVSLKVCEPFANAMLRTLNTVYQNPVPTLSRLSSDIVVRSNDRLNTALEISLLA